MRRGLAVVVGALAIVGLAVACGDDADSGTPSIIVTDALVPEPAGANGALYMDVANEGDGDDRLVAVRTDVATSAEVHRTESGDDDRVRMVAVDEVEVPAGESVAFEPGGLHVMLLGADGIVDGDVITVELDFERSGTVTVEAEVGAIGAGGIE